ncbi:MAG: sodium/solute symporter [Planctomycetales bacterium]|nr:sodium/solute symporter [Planctomycetales bacterium]
METTFSSALSLADHLVIAAYLGGMIWLGLRLARSQHSGEDFFLAGRNMPWFAVGVSVIASLLSSLTYLSEPGEVWSSGVTHMFGKMLAIPFEMAIVWWFCIPYMMRFKYTSAYEYLHDRFGPTARQLGVWLFLLMVVLWMGFVVLATARPLARLSGMSLPVVIATIGIVATVYTTLGGLRAVIWTDVVQVALLIGGGVFAIGYVAWQTGSGPGVWYATTAERLRASGHEAMPLFSFDPTVRATVFTVALNMFVWHVCTHIGNQMTVQRYFSTSSTTAARRSFVTGSLLGVGLNLMLMLVGLAMLHFYIGQDLPLEAGLDPTVKQDRSLIFPTFAVHRLPTGMGGGILAALLAAAMSSIDSGVNSIATVLSVERSQFGRRKYTPAEVLSTARTITIIAGLAIAAAAYGLSFMPSRWGIVDAMPRTFNAVTGPLGGLFLVGMLLPRVGEAAAVIGACCGFAVAVGIGYSVEISRVIQQAGWLPEAWAWLTDTTLSFTWVMPAAVGTTLAVSALLGLAWPRESQSD